MQLQVSYAIKKCHMQLFLITYDMCNYIGQVARNSFFTSGNHKTICQCKIHGICHVKMTWNI